MNFLETVAALPDETLNFFESFSAVSASGLSSTRLKTIMAGSGMVISQAAGALSIAGGTTANAETMIRSLRPFAGDFTARFGVALSQRIANFNLEFSLADVIGDDLAFTVNSSTSLTVTIPGHPFNATSIGQGVNIGVFSLGTCIPGRYTISAISDNNVTFTVAGFPASGTGTCSVFGWNYHKILYTGTTATNYTVGASRYGWLSGDTTLTCNSTSSPGHIAVMVHEDGIVAHLDQLAASTSNIQLAPRGSIVQTLPDEGIPLYLHVRVWNGSTAPASSTTATINFVRVEKFDSERVSVTNVRPQSFNHALPVTLQSASNSAVVSVQGSTGHGSSAIGSPFRIAGRASTSNYTAVSSAQLADLVCTVVGAQVVKPYSIPEADYQVSSTLATTTQTAIKSAAGTGIRNYVTGFEIINNAATANVVTIQDGSTTIWQGVLGAAIGASLLVQLHTPLKTSTNAALNITLGSATSVYYNFHGYQAP